jgi:Holliday junction resolvase-like predicted endonuclease
MAMKRFLEWLFGAAQVGTGARDPRHALGERGERCAEAHYSQRGYTTVARRWRSPRGEVDFLVERKPPGAPRELVAVEVKTRHARRRDGRDDPVAETRADQLARVERALLSHPRARRRRRLGDTREPLLRVDLCAVLVRPNGEFELRVHAGRPFAAPAPARRTAADSEARRSARR